MSYTPASRRASLLGLGVAALLALTGVAIAQTATAPAAQADDTTVVFDSMPGTMPQNWASQGAQAYSMLEFGQRVQLAGAARSVTNVEIGFSSWTCENWATSDPCETTDPDATYDLPITVNLYAAGADGTVGALVATSSRTVAVPFRPSPGGAPSCTGSQFSLDGTTCSNGLAFTANFPFDAPTVPTDLVVGVQYSTQTYGPAPIGAKAPSNALNVGLEGVVTVGGVADSDHSVYINANKAKSYTADETGNDIDLSWLNTFHAGAHWDPYSPVPLRITAANPQPAPPVLPDTDTPPPAPSPEGADGQPLQPPTLPSAPPAAGGSVPVQYPDGTFLPNEWVQFVFYSVPQYSGSVQANAAGGLSGSIPVPSSITGGTHTLVATGTTSGVVSTAAITVAALAVTGLAAEQVVPAATLAALALLVGAAFVLVSVRRRRAV